MISVCAICGVRYEDEEQSTVCPHDKLLGERDLNRKKAAFCLLVESKTVRLKARPDIVSTIQTIDYIGMVGLRGISGHFDPSELEIVEGRTEPLRCRIG